MTSGIYLLSFGDMEYLYVGKSVDVEKRWKQHLDKFEKGTAAKNMQEMYDLYGPPNSVIIREAHPDHLDVLEPLYISAYIGTYGGARCLNASIPTIYDQPTANDTEIFNHDVYFKQSTLQHIRDLVYNESHINFLETRVNELDEEVTRLNEYLDNMHLTIDLTEEGNRWRSLALNNEAVAKELEQKLLEETRKSWWKKIWQ